MTKKRRVFDIDFDGGDSDVPAGTGEHRRGPMAAAITENAEALAERQSAEAQIRAENDALAHEHVRLKKAGLITDLIPLDQIHMGKLTRDRVAGRDADLDELKESIKAIGLSNPIRVEKLDHGYELIQGYRRLTAFRELLADTGDARFATIPAGINASGENLQQLYRRMVDENLVRRGVSFGEMANLAIAYRSEDPNVESYDQAVEVLYASSGRQRRSYIKQFVRLLYLIGAYVNYPETIPRALGLSLLKRVDDVPERVQLLADTLASAPERTAEEELRLLQDFLVVRAARPKTIAQKTAKTTFRMNRPEGVAKCTAADGRIELRLERDFSGLERQKLEDAVQAFFDTLDR